MTITMDAIKIVGDGGQKLKKSVINNKTFKISTFDEDEFVITKTKKDPYFESFFLMIRQILLVFLLIWFLIYEKGFEQLFFNTPQSMITKFFKIFGISTMLIACIHIMIYKRIVELLQRKSLFLIVFLLIVSISLGCGFTIYFNLPYDIGLMIGLLTCLLLLQLIWLGFSWEIRFDKMENYTMFENILFVILKENFLFYPNLQFFISLITHASVFYSIIILVLHIQLLRKCGERHLYSSIAVYSNLVILFLKMQLLLRVYINSD